MDSKHSVKYAKITGKLPYRMKIHPELNSATWLRLVKFTELSFNKNYLKFQKYKLASRDFSKYNDERDLFLTNFSLGKCQI